MINLGSSVLIDRLERDLFRRVFCVLSVMPTMLTTDGCDEKGVKGQHGLEERKNSPTARWHFPFDVSETAASESMPGRFMLR